MSHHRVRWRLFCSTLCLAAALIVDAPVAVAAKIKMVFPGPVTTFSLPYLVAQKKGWMDGLEVEDVHVTGDANAMRVLLSGNADIALVGTLNVLASIHAGANIRARPLLAADRRLQPRSGDGEGQQARRSRRQDVCVVGAGRAA